jgi:(1->4)-alpha-D-glucan 1-alpha-D-glucosylmutase
MKAYAIKAAREAKTLTSWLLPNTEYESAVISFVESILQPDAENPFLKEFVPFQEKVAFFGLWNSLAQTLLKIASPGVPDFYQGTELWDLNLVDPDNRRPVDFVQRARFLEEIIRRSDDDILALIADLLASKDDGRVKLFLIHRALKARQELAELFAEGSYFPVKVKGKHRRRVVAFGRQWGEKCAAAVVPRFLVGLVKEGESPLGELVWEDTHLILPHFCRGSWTNSITGQVLGRDHLMPVGRIFEHFPAALLTIGGSANPFHR